MEWSKRKVLVTGASSGLGLELARLLLKKGASLLLTYRSEGHLAKARSVLGRGDYTFLPLDQGRKDSIEHFLSSVSSFDDAFLNAGVYFPSGKEETFPDSTFRVNAIGTFFLLRGLIEQGTSSFVLTSSMNRAWPRRGIEYLIGQNVSKRASYAYSKETLSAFPALFPEIKIKVVEPGLMKTNIYGRNAPLCWKMVNRLLLPFGMSAEDAAAQMLAVLEKDGLLFAPNGHFRLRGKLVSLPYSCGQKEKEGQSFLRLLTKLGLI